MSPAFDSIYDHEDFKTFLQSLLERFPGRRRPLTLRELTVRMGYRSPRSLAMVLKGQRPPTSAMAQAASRALGLQGLEALYLELLCRRSRLTPQEVELAEAIRKFQKNQKAMAVLKSKHPEERELISRVIRVDPAHLSEAKSVLRKLVEDFSSRFQAASNDEGKDFALNVQFYESFSDS